MQAGAAMAVVGWWTGYKLGGVVALNTAEFFQQIGFDITGKLLFSFGNSYNRMQYWSYVY